MSTDFSSHGKDMKAVVVLTELSDLGWWHRIGRTARLFGCRLLASLAAFAQIAAFEVASIKPSVPDATRMSIQRDPGGGIVLSNVNLQILVSMTYNIESFQLSGGPSWLRIQTLRCGRQGSSRQLSKAKHG